MLTELHVSFLNWSFITVTGDYGIKQELSDAFTFYVKDYRHMPAYKNGMWDGQIRLYDTQSCKLPSGLFVKLIKFCKNNDIKLTYNKNMRVMLPEKLEMSVTELLEGYNLPFQAYDHQINAIEKMLSDKRLLVLSATSSGKSLNIYSTLRYLTEKGKKTLVIVPTTSLVEQLYKDCEDYGWMIHKHANKIHSGRGKGEMIVRVNDSMSFLGEDWVQLANGKRKKAKSLKETDEISDEYI